MLNHDIWDHRCNKRFFDVFYRFMYLSERLSHLCLVPLIHFDIFALLFNICSDLLLPAILLYPET